MQQEDIERFRMALPPYLSETDKRVMLSQLDQFPSVNGFFGRTDDNEPVQGDAWGGFELIESDGSSARITGIVLSNSCDLAEANRPDPDQRIIFAPLMDLGLYADLLGERGQSSIFVESLLDQIRKQRVNRIFFVPNNGELRGESLVFLDRIYSRPLGDVRQLQRVFSLSNYGWYVLLMKLSVHFTRMTDGVRRQSIEDIEGR